MLDEVFPDIAALTSGVGILKKYCQLDFHCYWIFWLIEEFRVVTNQRLDRPEKY